MGRMNCPMPQLYANFIIPIKINLFLPSFRKEQRYQGYIYRADKRERATNRRWK